ncbi:odorant receptor 82a-like isoform X2 [Leptopilina heterotoma]|uniref:odorant receptor 82a-like isoform X2 n=1 Tax=Leptopilina heterotoma TaxID=63436 RepID=UPI001CA85A08|nr:odorant receptor 82a-like isoform X2 [Leptopilina heterotoma]
MELDHYFYRINQGLLSACGVWPLLSKRQKIIRRFIFFIIDFSNFPPLIAYAVYNWRDADALSDCVTFIASYSLGIIKISTIIIQDKKIQYLFKQIQHDWSVWSSEPQVQQLEKFAEEGKSLNFIYTVAPQIYYLFVQRPNGTRESFLSPEEFGIDNEKHFYLILAFNNLSVWINSIIYIIVDSTYFTFVQHACGQLGAVGNRFENIKLISCNGRENNNDSLRFEEIYFCIQRYKKALKFTSLLNDLFSVYFFLIVGISATNLVFASLQTVINLDKFNETVKYGNYGLLLVCLLFLNSFPAQKLMDHSSNISQNIYNSCWYEMPVSLKKSLLFALMRTSRICAINIGKFYVLSMQTFASIVRTTVSLCMLLLSIR